jgi:hypothetical protein
MAFASLDGLNLQLPDHQCYERQHVKAMSRKSTGRPLKRRTPRRTCDCYFFSQISSDWIAPLH